MSASTSRGLREPRAGERTSRAGDDSSLRSAVKTGDGRRRKIAALSVLAALALAVLPAPAMAAVGTAAGQQSEASASPSGAPSGSPATAGSQGAGTGLVPRAMPNPLVVGGIAAGCLIAVGLLVLTPLALSSRRREERDRLRTANAQRSAEHEKSGNELGTESASASSASNVQDNNQPRAERSWETTREASEL